MFQSFDRWSQISTQWNPVYTWQKARSAFTEARNGSLVFHLSAYSSTPSHTFQPPQQSVCVAGAKVVLPSRKMFEIQVAGRKMQSGFGRLLLKLHRSKGCGLMSKPFLGFEAQFGRISSSYDMYTQFYAKIHHTCMYYKLNIGKTIIPTPAAVTRAICNNVQTESASDQLPSSRTWLPFGVQILL